MNFLSKTLSTLTGGSIPYKINEKIVDPLSGKPFDSKFIWTIYNGLNPKQDNAPVTILEFDLRDPTNVQRGFVSLARNCFKKSKLLRFPGILSIIDFIETDSYLYIIAEQVTPLQLHAEHNANSLSDDVKICGLYNVTKTLSFINANCNYLYGGLNFFTSIFVTPGGDWKVFGFELLTNLSSDPDQPIYRHSMRFPGFDDGISPEVANGGIEAIKSHPFLFDSYRLGVFIHTLFNTSDFRTPKTHSDQKLFSNTGRIPSRLVSSYKKLISPKHNLRIPIDKFAQETKLFFESNSYVSFSNQLEEIKFKADDDKLHFFKFELATYAQEGLSDAFSSGFLEYKLLPEIVTQFNNTFTSKPKTENHQSRQETLSVLLNYILKFGSGLQEGQFNKLIKPIVLQSFSIADRSIRFTLLTHLPSYSHHLTEQDVQQKIFFNLITGFQDTNYMIRETTLKSITDIIDKTSVKQINQDLLKVLAKSQMDTKPSIRVNTLILIIKISSKIYSNSKNNVLITALSKSLRDSFTPSKMTALSGFESLIDEFTLDEICSKILGQLAISLMDGKSAKVRGEARRVFSLFLDAVEKHAATLPVTEEDDDAEEREFFRATESKASTAANEDLTQGSNGSFSNLGWSVVNKLVTSSVVGGELDKNFNNVSTPDLTRTNTSTFNTAPKHSNSAAPSELEDNDLIDEMDAWDIEDDSEEKEIVQNTNTQKPLATRQPGSRPKPVSRTSNSQRKPSTLKLGPKAPTKKPGSTLKLSLDMDDDEDDKWDMGEW